ncbi:MAG: hypothetical protein ACI906_001597 [Candidatus Latescibacterota bacterium]|jgi:hypothetical protein
MPHSARLFTILLAAALFSPLPARACGGFFCSNSPMDQVAENILFVVDQGRITTHVQLQFSGSATDFAWVLPVPSIPELGISHNQIFSQLQWSTQPFFNLNWREDDACGFPAIFRFDADCPTCAVAETVKTGGVEVVLRETVGPYEAVVITSEDAEAITTWLTDNNYQLGELGAELLAPYVEMEMYFLALRLSPDREVGDLQPIALTYDAEEPGIPIKLTAIATQPDLGVTAWILGEERAIPKNYLHAQVNEALIDWFNGGFNYPQVVSAAADEAGGHAFVTDYAGPSDIVTRFSFGKFDVEELRLQKDPVNFLDIALSQGFPRDVQMQALIRRHVPIPPGVRTEGVLEVWFGGDRDAYSQAIADGALDAIVERSFYNNMRAYAAYTEAINFDAAAFVADLEAVVIEPLANIDQLFKDHSYLTRLYTTLSAAEMTVDPMFAFNPDLPGVPNMRQADAHWDCADPENTPPEEWVLVVTLKDGREIRTRPFVDGGPRPLPLEPAAAVIEQFDTSGPPQILRVLTAVVEKNQQPTPTDWALAANFPNPFNAGTVIPFHAPEAATDASLRIYNLQGQLVRTLFSGPITAGSRQVRWDGLSDHGTEAASGAYFSSLQFGDRELKRKLMLLR